MKYVRTFVCPADGPEVRNPCPAGGPDHTPCPKNDLPWFHWFGEIQKTHVQSLCPACDLWAIWTPKEPG